MTSAASRVPCATDKALAQGTGAALVSDKRDDEEHERKRKRWEKETWPSILKRARQLKAVILFGDEVSFAQGGSLFRTWTPRGKQPKVPTCGKRKGMESLWGDRG